MEKDTTTIANNDMAAAQHTNARRRANHVHPTQYPTRYSSPAPSTSAPTIMPSSTAPTTGLVSMNSTLEGSVTAHATINATADSFAQFLFLGKNNVTGSSSSNVTGSSNSTDGVIEDQELPSTPPPEYTDAPLLPSCSRPPAWADEDMTWSNLSDDQRQAALYLGYTSAAWDADDDTTIDQLYAALDWSSGLSSDQRLAFAYLGYNSGSYENFYSDYNFAELPADVQDAAKAVGYDQEVWDECDEEVCAKVDDKYWKGLKKGERINMKVLGYDCWTWNNYDPAPCV